MARTINRISATKLAALKSPGYYADGGNLYHRIAPGGSRGWIFRFAKHGRTRDMGMGPYPEISLATARKRAFELRQLVADDIDPIKKRQAERDAARVEDAKTITFDDCAKAYIAAHEAEWRSATHRQQWANTLAQHVSPVIGRLPVRAIDDGLVLRVLERNDFWSARTETASRVRGRIEAVLDWARVRGYRTGENPARWRGHLEHQLASKTKSRQVKHYAALPYAQVGKFMQAVGKRSSTTARALEFLVLTAARAGEVLNATWDEVDLDACVWTVPANRTKANREHRVPLSKPAIAVLRTLDRRSDYLFPSVKRGNWTLESRLTGFGPRFAIGPPSARLTKIMLLKWRSHMRFRAVSKRLIGAAIYLINAAA
jgi:integrase